MQFLRTTRHNKSLFDLGKTIFTKDGMGYILQHDIDITKFLKKHQSGDWSHMSKWYQNANREAVKGAGYVISTHSYKDQAICIITDRSKRLTTISRSYEVVINPNVAPEH
jgi:hypothetical protein